MDGARPQPPQTVKVSRGAVALVTSEPVPGIDLIKLHHQVVAGHLGYYRGTGNRKAETITVMLLLKVDIK